MRYGLRHKLSLLILVVGAQAGYAAVLQVDQADPDCNDATGSPAFCSLVPAVEAAFEGDSIQIGAGTYSGPGNRGIDTGKSLSIEGSGVDATRFDLEGTEYLLDIDNFGDDVPPLIFSLRDLSIEGGSASGSMVSIFTHFGDLTMERLRFFGSLGSGASIGVRADAEQSSILVRDIEVRDNQQGGLMVWGTWNLINAVVENSVFESNGGADGYGGAYIVRGIVRNCAFVGNESPGQGGGLAIQGFVENSQFENNSAVEGGGIGFLSRQNYEEYRRLVVRNSLFIDNIAARGAAIGGDIPVIYTPIPPPGLPQPLAIDKIQVTGSTFFGNASTEAGGAVFLDNGITSTEVVEVLLRNNTFTGNVAPASSVLHAGGIVDLDLEFNTILDNPATTGAGLEFDNIAVRYGHNVLSGTSTLCALSPEVQIDSQGYNFASDDTCNALFTADTDVTGLDQLLGPLADNGGPTMTHLPLEGSPLIDSGGGDCPEIDQRGYGRPAGDACDRGAVEAGAVPLGLDAMPVPASAWYLLILLAACIAVSGLRFVGSRA